MRTISIVVGLLSAALVISSAPASSESLRKGLGRIGHQAEVNARSVKEKAKAAIDKAGEQGETNLKHAGTRLERDAKNFIRWVRESNCDRVGRKKGAKARRQCEAQAAANREAHQDQLTGGFDKYYAAIEVDCWKPGEKGRFGTTTIQAWSNESKQQARARVLSKLNARNVCRQSWQYSKLEDGQHRWVSDGD